MCRYLATELADYHHELQEEEEGKSINNLLLMGHVFKAFKARYNIMTEFKSRVAERMIRQTLLAF